MRIHTAMGDVERVGGLLDVD